jgi:hypothetical protein
MRIIQHWFGYRKRNARGRHDGTGLNDTMAEQWTLATTEQLRDLIAVLEGCVTLEESQADVLDRVTAGPLITMAELEESDILPSPGSARHCVPGAESQALF